MASRCELNVLHSYNSTSQAYTALYQDSSGVSGVRAHPLSRPPAAGASKPVLMVVRNAQGRVMTECFEQARGYFTWMMFTDLDEWMMVTNPKYNHSIPAVLREHEAKAGAVLVHRVDIGSSGVLVRTAGRMRVCHSFCRMVVVQATCEAGTSSCGRCSGWPGGWLHALVSRPSCVARVRPQERTDEQGMLNTFTACTESPSRFVRCLASPAAHQTG
jgi:hypothetical protein